MMHVLGFLVGVVVGGILVVATVEAVTRAMGFRVDWRHWEKR